MAYGSRVGRVEKRNATYRCCEPRLSSVSHGEAVQRQPSKTKSLRVSMSRNHPDDTRRSSITWSLGILPEFQAGVSLEPPLKSKPIFEHEPAQNAGRMPTLPKVSSPVQAKRNRRLHRDQFKPAGSPSRDPAYRKHLQKQPLEEHNLWEVLPI